MSDWLDADHTAEELTALAADTRAPGEGVTLCPRIDPTTMPVHSWLYRPHYIRQFLSLIISTAGPASRRWPSWRRSPWRAANPC